MLSRRPLISGLLSTLTMPAMARDFNLLVPLISQGQINDTQSSYGIMARPGVNGPQDTLPIEIMLPGETKIFLQIPPKVLYSNVIVFSHGELGSPDLYKSLFQHWASHGFIVIAPIHNDSLIRNTIPKQSELRAGTEEIVLKSPEAWFSRIEQLRTCVDALPWIQSQTGIKLNTEHLMIAGHSFGAFCASILMGTEVTLPNGLIYKKEDKRFFGALLMSPQGRGILGLRDKSWDNTRGPLMVITGRGDVDLTGQSPDVKAETYFLSPPGNKHLAWMSNISPPWFLGDQIYPGQQSELVFNDMLAMSTCFLRAYAEYNQNLLSILSSPTFAMPAISRLQLSFR